MSPDVWIPLAFAWLVGSLVLTVALALAARFALAPVLDAAARLRHGPGEARRFAALEGRCRRLERRLDAPAPRPERSGGRSA